MASTIEAECPRIETMDFTEKLNHACKLRRLTNQRELADLARVSKSSLNRWLQGGYWPSVLEAARLAQVLEVPLDWLVSDDEIEKPPLSTVPKNAAVLKLIQALELDEDEALRRLATPLATGEAWLPGSVRDQTSTVKRTSRPPSKPAIPPEELLDGQEDFLPPDDPLRGPPQPPPRRRKQG